MERARHRKRALELRPSGGPKAHGNWRRLGDHRGLGAGLRVPQHQAQLVSFVFSILPATLPATWIYWRQGWSAPWLVGGGAVLGLWAGTDRAELRQLVDESPAIEVLADVHLEIQALQRVLHCARVVDGVVQLLRLGKVVVAIIADDQGDTIFGERRRCQAKPSQENSDPISHGKPFGAEQDAAMQKPEGEITEVSYMFPRPGADKTPVPKVSLVTRVGDLGCGSGYYKQ
jgi:hypothetical protein